MTASYQNKRPEDFGEFRQQLYQGALYKLPASSESLALVEAANQRLEESFPGEDPRSVHQNYPPQALFERLGVVRKAFFTEENYHQLLKELLKAYQIPAEEIAFDPLRLRVVHPGGHHNPRAQAVYSLHRDTWYSLSQSVVAGWIALHDTGEDESFEVYPDYFKTAVRNSSEHFDYQAWVADKRSLRIGWQDHDAGKDVDYIQAEEVAHRGTTVKLSAKKGEFVLFSGAHLHQTLAHDLSQTRYSLDFRWVHLSDYHQSIGAPNVDSLCRGSAVPNYENYQAP